MLDRKIEEFFDKDQIESIIKKKKELELRYIDTIRPIKGHSIWEINETTLEVKKAEFSEAENQRVNFHEAVLYLCGAIDHLGQRPMLIRRKGYVYLSALNAKNALYRYTTNKGSANRPEGFESLI